jgi:hypothetical protein
MFFFKKSKNTIWITSTSKKNTEISIGFFLLIILTYFLCPNLFVNFSIALGLALF